MPSVLVAVKLGSKESQGTLQYVVRQLADVRQDLIHVLCVILQRESREEERRQAQEQIRQQYGSLLRGRPHKLHIVRVVHSGSVGNRPSAAAFISRAICAKAALLQSNVIVVGGKVRQSAAGTPRNSAVAESVRRHSRQPVLLISDEHPLLEDVLPSIVEEPPLPESLPLSGRATQAGVTRSCSLTLPELTPQKARSLSGRAAMLGQRQLGYGECNQKVAVPTLLS